MGDQKWICNKFAFNYRHGQKWHDFRAQVQQVALQPAVARQYITPLNHIADDFMDRWKDILVSLNIRSEGSRWFWVEHVENLSILLRNWRFKVKLESSYSISYGM
jgi:hypothetical protein